jgi:putative transposase
MGGELFYREPMLLQRAYVYRLEPTSEQETFLAQTAGACRALYNLALEQRMMWRPGRKITLKSQSHELTALRNDVDWMRAAPVHALQSALKDLDRAFENFFAGRASYPRFKRKGDGDGFHLKDKSYLDFKRLNRSKGAVKIPKIGWVKLRGWRPLGGELRNVTISKRAGHWYAAIAWQTEVAEPAPSHLPPVGIDRGIAIFAACSTGTNYTAPPFFRRIETKLANAQRKLARQVKGSANGRKQRARIARLHSTAANARRDFLHKASFDVAKNHGAVAIEKLQVKNMSRSAKGTAEAPGRNVAAKSGLNRSILDKGWSKFATFLRYKLEERGGELIEVPPEYTSQTCSECGTISKESRKSQSEFVCIGCGASANADTNAARNILRLGHSRWACQANRTSGRQQELSEEAAYAA